MEIPLYLYNTTTNNINYIHYNFEHRSRADDDVFKIKKNKNNIYRVTICSNYLRDDSIYNYKNNFNTKLKSNIIIIYDKDLKKYYKNKIYYIYAIRYLIGRKYKYTIKDTTTLEMNTEVTEQYWKDNKFYNEFIKNIRF
jgi:hypothetical protein